MKTVQWLVCGTMMGVLAGAGRAEVCNLKVVTDASPDYADLPSMVHSMTSKWKTEEEKCWAVFYWNHIARRQTSPMELHGMALTDPIRQFNDYGYTMCSTISGINQGIWEAMGLKHRYWDISNHTVPEVFYDGRWHMYDNSMSALYTLCDGKTLAGVEDIGKAGACAASVGKKEAGHVAKYHCLTATSPLGFLSGADCARSLDEEYRCFNPNGLKLRTYFHDWDWGHRYVLNLREGENYTRYYRSLGDGAGFYVPNGGKDPESANKRYRIRGNGVWVYRPGLADAHEVKNVVAAGGWLRAEKAGEAVFKVEAGNVVTSQVIAGKVRRKAEGDRVEMLVSVDNGLHWKSIFKAEEMGEKDVRVELVGEVNGAYEVLVKVLMDGDGAVGGLEIRTTTEVNSKTQPRLNLGKNTVYVGTGEQTESAVFWPELQGGKYKEMVVEEKNVASAKEHPGYMGVIHPAKAKEDAYIVYRIDTPREMTKVTYGGRFYNRAPKSYIDMLHSFDEGKSWVKTWSITDTGQPWDVIHYETVEAPAGTRAVWVKYLMNTTEASVSGCSIYAVRMEANYRPAKVGFEPVTVTFTWKERQADRSAVERSHTAVVEKVPMKYAINVGGMDHPVMESLKVGIAGAEVKRGYSDGKEVAAEKFVGKWVTYGKNVAVGKKYTLSHPSEKNWEAGDPDGTKLTDGVAGPPYAGGISYRYGAVWNPNTNPVISLDLGESMQCASFGLNIHGYPFWDALKGEVEDQVEVLVSEDGKEYRSVGFLQTDLKWRDLPVNHMWPDEETIGGHTYRVIPAEKVKARFVRYRIKSARHCCVTEVEVLDGIRLEPFDLRVALPGE